MDTETTGKTVGTVFAGILIGILSARVFGGLVAEWFGWRSVFGISAVSMLLLTLMLRIILPDIPNTFRGRYRELLISALKQIPRFPRLRKASMSGFLLFGVFCSFWTTLTFHLSRPPFLFHSDTIGLFGLVAIAGALIAPAFGKRADKGLARHSMILAVSLTIVSIILLKFISDSVMAILFAVFLLDIGVQILQVTNMAVIYSLDATSHSRVNTIFMTTLFIGGAVGTSAGLYCWKTGGWDWVTWQMLLWSVLALIVVLLPDTEASIKDISVGEQRLPDGAQSK
jgi:predicted MFS family arabinose efflux permease